MINPRCAGPYVIAAVGGSGYRVVAGTVRQAGVYIGTRLNGPLDALDFADYCARWIPTFIGGEAGAPSSSALAQMKRHLHEVVAGHLADLDAGSHGWGWKNSGSLHLLPFLHGEFPDLTFIHVVRDGRDIAYSSNQYQVRRYGHRVLTPVERRASQPLQSIALWSRLNLAAAAYAEQHLPDRYLVVRFEDLCESPVQSVRRILDFCGLNGDASRIASDQIVTPPSIGRWRIHDPNVVARLHEAGGAALQKFGYWDGVVRPPAGGQPRDRAMAFEQALRSRLSAGAGGHIAERLRLLRQTIRGLWPQGR